eukprot:gb/GEZN01012260.1/.p1 GENE.gb/GEZN01012260.1/~~gb/GEZN01012260.1/.p1  ORF type:complete len:267 (-),score=-14.74 gb/GEZN01012260.1/:295-1074(-)
MPCPACTPRTVPSHSARPLPSVSRPVTSEKFRAHYQLNTLRRGRSISREEKLAVIFTPAPHCCVRNVAQASELVDTYPAKRYIVGPGLRGGSEIGGYLLQGNIKHLAFGTMLIFCMLVGTVFSIGVISYAINHVDCKRWEKDFFVIGGLTLFFFVVCMLKTGHDCMPDHNLAVLFTQCLNVIWLIVLITMGVMQSRVYAQDVDYECVQDYKIVTKCGWVVFTLMAVYTICFNSQRQRRHLKNHILGANTTAAEPYVSDV